MGTNLSPTTVNGEAILSAEVRDGQVYVSTQSGWFRLKGGFFDPAPAD